MTIREAIQRTDALLVNTYSLKDKLEWLNAAEWNIKNRAVEGHEESNHVFFMPYDEYTDMDTVLLAPPPFDELYLRWLEAQIHYHNDEMDRYNAAIILYNRAFNAYADYFKRNHMPRSRGKRFLF